MPGDCSLALAKAVSLNHVATVSSKSTKIRVAFDSENFEVMTL